MRVASPQVAKLLKEMAASLGKLKAAEAAEGKEVAALGGLLHRAALLDARSPRPSK